MCIGEFRAGLGECVLGRWLCVGCVCVCGGGGSLERICGSECAAGGFLCVCVCVCVLL